LSSHAFWTWPQHGLASILNTISDADVQRDFEDRSGPSDAHWELANNVLASRGMTTVREPQSGVYRAFKLADASSVAPIDPPSTPELDSSRPVSGYGTMVVAIRHRPARDLVEPISRLPTKPGSSVVPVTSGTGGSAGGVAGVGGDR
jgi:hypothetical protein